MSTPARRSQPVRILPIKRDGRGIAFDLTEFKDLVAKVIPKHAPQSDPDKKNYTSSDGGAVVDLGVASS
jgi:hypothetical protein